MTHFERTYILNRHRSNIAIQSEDNTNKKSDVIDLTHIFQKQKEEMAMQIKAYQFAITDIALYLDTHPEDKNAINIIDPYLGFLGEVNDTTNLDPNGNITNVANFNYKFTAEANKTYYFVVMCSKLSGALQTFYPAEFDIMITK